MVSTWVSMEVRRSSNLTHALTSVIAHRSGCTLISQVPRKLHGAQDRARRVFGRAGRRWRVRRASRRQWAAACVHALQCGARRCRAVALSMSASERCPCACRVPMLSGHFFASLLLLMWYQYGQNTSPTVYITAIQMAPSGERFFRSSCAPLIPASQAGPNSKVETFQNFSARRFRSHPPQISSKFLRKSTPPKF